MVPADRLRAGQLRLAPLVLGYRFGLVSGTRIRAELALSRFDRIHAYGDTPEDRPMLLLADVAHYLPCGWPEGLGPCPD